MHDDLKSRNTSPSNSSLSALGWEPRFQAQLELLQQPDWTIARVVGEKPPLYVVRDASGADLWVEIPGRWRHRADSREDFPSIGDWVAIERRPGENRATLRHLFERKSMLARKAAGTRERMQIIASNVDTAFIVTSLNDDLNLRRLERYLAVVWDGGATPVVLLSKLDLVPSSDEAIAEAKRISRSAEVIPYSAHTGQGLERVRNLLSAGQTFVVIGSSGVGKSTLVNSLMGEDVMATREIREGDAKGRHTTTARHLFVLPSNAILIDTPGMRELGLWDAEQGLETLFDDLEELAQRCKFTNCRHEKEPGCAIRAALEAGEIDPDRVESYRKLGDEIAARAKKKGRGRR